jgi:PKD domain
MWVTADCVDPLYNRPVIDSQTDLTTPVPHHKVSGHFDGTTKRFNFYFPPKSQGEGRFFQSVYPLQDEYAIDDPTAPSGPPRETAGSIAFGADSGAYTVQTNGGSGYRVDAAAAKFSKMVAASYYGSSRRIYGYIYGGSGGSYQTIGAIENSSGVWDGAVPYVPGVPTSIPNNFFVRAFARFVLQDKAAQIADAVSPGGSGDPYAGLDDVERAVLLEVTRMGVPLRGWEDYAYVLGLNDPQGLLGFGGVVQSIDPTYADDFWSKPDYLGTEQSALGDLFRAALRSDNRWSLALLSYHRHQVPSRPGFYAWDQFRGPDGQPIYPQRSIEIGPLITRSVTGGGTHTGMINGKVIVVANLLDVDAYPWHADWYAQRVKEALGDRFDDNFRVWYNDNADHIGPRTARLVQYAGILQQALRDVSAWAERGVAPARSTRYDVVDSQIRVPANAAARRGIQPIVDLTVNDAARIDVAAGQPITFVAKIQIPPGAGKVVSTEWDFLGDGNFTASPFGSPKQTVEVSVTFTYTTPGTYFPALRATAQREGNTSTPFARVQNLGRVRVVVH